MCTVQQSHMNKYYKATAANRLIESYDPNCEAQKDYTNKEKQTTEACKKKTQSVLKQ